MVEKATRLAAEIEGEVTDNFHIQEERNQVCGVRGARGAKRRVLV